jgi:hypothetical protein
MPALTATELQQIPLEKLLEFFPIRSWDIADTAMLGRASDNRRWVVVYRDYHTIADTPKQAVINLLLQIGVL